MYKPKTTTKYRKAYTLIEVLVVLTMSALVIVTVLKIHSQVRKAAAAVSEKIDSDAVPTNILQRIAEDIDRLSSTKAEMQYSISNKIRNDVSQSRLIISSYYYDNNNRRQLYEQVIWQSYYDDYDETMYLFRSHGGVAIEDSVLDVLTVGDDGPSQAELQADGKERFIPVCDGMTFFEFSIPQGPEKDPLYAWSSSKAPGAITASISFAEPIEDIFGDYIIPPDQLYQRIIATDRVRKIKFQFVRQEFEPDDPNELDGDPNEIDSETLDENTDKVISTIEKENGKE
jgi:hypothetical protein